MRVDLYQDLYNTEESHWWHVTKRQVVKQALQTFKAQGTLLDIGCGTGKNLELLSEFGTATGVDSAAAALAFCRQRHQHTVLRADLEKTLPFPDSTFDVVTALDVLEHVNDTQALAEVHRILKPHGLLIASVPALPQLWSGWDDILHHRRRYTRHSLTQVLQSSRFQLQKISYLYAFLVIPVALVRWWKTKKGGGKKVGHEYQSDFAVGNRVTFRICSWLSCLEQWLFWRTGLPIGTSLFVVAHKAPS